MTADLVRIERHGDSGHVAELVLNRPDVIQGVHESMIAAGAEERPPP